MDSQISLKGDARQRGYDTGTIQGSARTISAISLDNNFLTDIFGVQCTSKNRSAFDRSLQGYNKTAVVKEGSDD